MTGRSGSGKTTLIRALLGLLPLEEGGDMLELGAGDRPGGFFRPPRSAYSAQNPALWSDTLRENILLGMSDDGTSLSRAVRLAVLEPDIAALEHGLDTLVGSRGTRLSGGQRVGCVRRPPALSSVTSSSW